MDSARILAGKIALNVPGRGYVRKYCNVQNRTFMYGFKRDFDHFCAQILSVNQIESKMPKSRISCEKMCEFCI